MNIVEPILYQCKLNPFATAIATPGSGIGSVKYGQLEKLIHNVARSAIKAGLAPGDVAAIFIADPIPHAALILGLMRIGVVTMSLSEASVPEHIKTDAIITEAPQFFVGAGNVIAFNASWLQGEGAPLDYERVYRCKPEDDCCISLTSGSTGRQKGIAFSHRLVAERVCAFGYEKGMLFSRTSRLFCGLGIASAPGFYFLSHMLFRGGTAYFPGREPGAILQYLDPYKIQCLTLSPYDLDTFLKFFEADPALQCKIDLIVCQGAKLSRELAERARARICQNLYTSYGSTEAYVTAYGPSRVVSRTAGAVGYIGPGVTVDIVDGDGRLLPLGREGSIRVRSPRMVQGYVNDPEATAQMFRDGAFYSGDLGYVTADGLLVLTGREKTALSVGGDTVAPEIIEEVLCGFTGIDQAAAFTLDDALGIAEVHALIVTRAGVDETALRAHCEGKLRPNFVPVRFIKVEAIPRGGQGKIDRPRLAEIAKVQLKKPAPVP